MIHRMWLLVCTGLVVSACAGRGLETAPAYPPALYSQRVGTNDVTIYWGCTREETQVRFEGVVQNVRGGAVRFMELELAGADARDRYISAATTTLTEVVLQTSQIAPFAIQLRPVGGENRLDLFYRYQVESALGGDERPHFRALDVCSPARHRFKE